MNKTNNHIPTVKFRRFSYIACCVAACCFPNAYAMSESSEEDIEQDIEVLTVTADLSQRDLNELPATATLISQLSIETRQARHIQDLMAVVPNVNFSSGASRGKFIQIRGIGERSQFSEPINPSIGLILDDIDISGIGSLATVFDASQIEILSGPQSVATGLNSLGGIVKIVSNSPTDELYANIGMSVAQFGERRLSAVYSNGLNESINARFSVQNTQSDGFVENAFLGRDDTSGIDETSLSALFDISLGDNTQINVNAYYFDIENGYDAFSLDNSNVTLSDEPGFDNAQAEAASIKLSHNFSSHKLQITAFRLQADTAYAYDEDWTFTGISPIGYTSFDQYNREIVRQGFDVKLANLAGGDSDYLLGFNISSQDEDLLRQYTFASGDYFSHYSPDNSAIYGQYAHAVSDDMNITFAARLEQFDAEFSDIEGFSASANDDLFAAALTLDYDLGGNFVYASLSRGYKAGGFNVDQRLAADNRAFAPEYNDNIELGIKGRAYDGMANINLTFFYMQRKDAQVSDFATFIETDENGTTITSFADAVGNSDTGVNKGIEVTSTWDLSDNWYIQANAGYLDATIGNYTQLNGDFVEKRQQAQAPKYTVYLASTWEINDAYSWFIDADAKDDYRFSDGHDERAPFTLVVNTELAYQQEAYTLKLWVKNLFDRTVLTRGFGGFPNDPRDGYTTFGPYYQFGQERQIGLDFTYTWE